MVYILNYNYNKTFDKHDFGVTGGYTYESYVSRSSGLGAFDFVNETLGNENSNGNALYLIIMQWVEQRKL